MSFEQQYEDVLQNLEFAIVSVYRENPKLVDKSVLRVLNELIDNYVREAQGVKQKGVFLPGPSQLMYDRVNEICQFRLGHISIENNTCDPTIAIDELISCLKRIRQSVKMWRKELGKQGYLNYVSKFIK